MPLEIKLASSEDSFAVDSLAEDVLGYNITASELIESAFLNLVAFDTDKKAIVGFLCLDDEACARIGQDDSLVRNVFAGKAALLFHKLCSSAFVRACITVSLYEFEAVNEMLKSALTHVPFLERLLLVTNTDITFSEPGISSVFSKRYHSSVSSSETKSANPEGISSSEGFLFIAERSAVLPPFHVRTARVEDHDECMPIFESSKRIYPALSQLPDWSAPDEPYALTRVIDAQDDKNHVLVAQLSKPNADNDDDEAEMEIVGCLVASSGVDHSDFIESFDLHPYDNFLPAEQYEEQWAEASALVYQRKYSLARSERYDVRHRLRSQEKRRRQEQIDRVEKGKEGEYAGEEAAAGATQPSGEVNAEEAAEVKAREEAEAAEKAKKEDEEDEAAVVAAAQPTDEEIKQEMLDLFAGQQSDVESSAFFVTLVSMKSGFEHRAFELISAAFAHFPDKQHCLLTLPHSAAEAPVTHSMVRLPPVPGSLHPNVLFLTSRGSLSNDFRVQVGTIQYLSAVEELVRGMPNAADIMESYLNACQSQLKDGVEISEEPGGAAVLAMCANEVVGVLTVNLSVDIELLMANFRLGRHFDLASHGPEVHGEMDMVCINPIFENRFRIFLSAAQRLLGKRVLYYALPPAQPPPPLLDVMTQAAPRHRIADRLQADFALYVFCRRTAFQRRVNVNSHVVVVGASECGLALLESLLIDLQLQFNHITLLAPGGIKVGGVACQYSASIVAKLGLDARLTLLDAELIGLDRERRILDLSDDSQIAFDVLIIAAGLQDQSRYVMVDACPDVAGILVTDLELAANFTKDDAFTMSNIIVYGNSLQSYNALHVLENRGAGAKVTFSAPPGEEDPFVKVMRQAAAGLGVSLPVPLPEEITHVAKSPESGTNVIATVTLEKRLGAAAAAVPGDGRRSGAAADAATESLGPAPDSDFPPGEGVERPGSGGEEGGEEGGDDGTSPTDDWIREVNADLIVGCAPPSVGQHFFECLNDASLVFDGRLVVNADFKTNDPNIFAAGSIAKFSRRYGGTGLKMQYFNSKELGLQVASFIAQHVASSSTASPPGLAAAIEDKQRAHGLLLKQQPQLALKQKVQLSSGKVVGCTLSGGLVFLFAGKAEAMMNPALEPPAGGQALRTVTSRGLFHINLEDSGEVYSIIYLGRAALTPMRLGTLVGLHASYLNGIQSRYEKGEIHDLLTFLTEPWAELLYHDRFPELRRDILEAALLQVASGGRGSSLGVAALTAVDVGKVAAASAEVTTLTQDVVLGFVRSHAPELTMYHLNY